MSVRATDGAIKAMLSGKNYRRDQLDLVWHGTRQTGSAFAVHARRRVRARLPAGQGVLVGLAPVRPPRLDQRGRVREQRRGRRRRGLMDLWGATQNSVNVVFAQLALDVGPEHIVDAAQRMGITVGLDAVPAITLGVEEVPTMDMAAAYATLANDGVHCDSWAVRKVEYAGVPKTAPKGHGSSISTSRGASRWSSPRSRTSSRRCCNGSCAAARGGPRSCQAGRSPARPARRRTTRTCTSRATRRRWRPPSGWGSREGQKPMDSYYGASVFGRTHRGPDLVGLHGAGRWRDSRSRGSRRRRLWRAGIARRRRTGARAGGGDPRGARFTPQRHPGARRAEKGRADTRRAARGTNMDSA